MATEQTSRNFLDYIQAFGQALESKEQKDQFVANFTGGDKGQEKTVKQFLKNNIVRPLTPRWALKDTKFRANLTIARRLWSGQPAEAASEVSDEEEEAAPSNRNGKRVRIAETVEIYNPNAPNEEEPAPKKKTARKPAKQTGKKGQDEEAAEENEEQPVVEAAVELGEGELQIVEQEEADAEVLTKKTARKPAKGKKAPVRVKKPLAKGQENEEEVAEVMDMEEPAVLQQEEGVEEEMTEQKENDAPSKKTAKKGKKALARGKKADQKESGAEDRIQHKPVPELGKVETETVEYEAPPKRTSRKHFAKKSRGKKTEPEEDEEASVTMDQQNATVLEEIVEQAVDVVQREVEKGANEDEETDNGDVPKKNARKTAKKTSVRGKKVEVIEEAVDEDERQEESVEKEELTSKADRRTAKQVKKAQAEEEAADVFGEAMEQEEPVVQQGAAVIQEAPDNNETGVAPDDPEIVPTAPTAQQVDLTELTAKINELSELFQQVGNRLKTGIEAKLDEMVENSRRQTELYQQNKTLLEEMFAYIKQNNVQNVSVPPPRAPTPYDQVAETENQAPVTTMVLQVKKENVKEARVQEKVVVKNILVKEEPISPQGPVTDRLIKPSLIPRAARAFK